MRLTGVLLVLALVASAPPALATALPDGAGMAAIPGCSQKQTGVLAVRLCSVGFTSTTAGPQPFSVRATATGVPRSARLVRACFAAFDTMTNQRTTSVTCIRRRLLPTTAARRSVSIPHVAFVPVGSALRAAMSAPRKGARLSVPRFAATPALLPPQPQQLTCSLGSADARLLARSGEQIGTVSMCVDGQPTQSTAIGRLVASLPAGDYRMRVCVRFSNFDADLLRGDACTYADVRSPGHGGLVWMQSDAVSYIARPTDYPIASAYASIYVGEDEIGESALRDNDVVVRPEPA